MQRRHDPPPLVAQPLPPATQTDVELQRLLAFWGHPAKGFLRQRLDVATSSWDEEPDDALPVELDALQDWKVGDRALQARLRGDAPDQVRAVEAARDELPPGPLTLPVLRKVGARVDAIVAATTPYRQGEAETVDVEVALTGDRRLLGNIAGVHGTTVVRTTYSTLRSKHKLPGSSARTRDRWTGGRAAGRGAAATTLVPGAPPMGVARSPTARLLGVASEGSTSGPPGRRAARRPRGGARPRPPRRRSPGW